MIPLKYQQRHKCYTGPITYNDLSLITCPKLKFIVRADVLTKCYSREGTFLCPDEIFHRRSHDSTWLGLPWSPGSRIHFPRHHVPTTCDSFESILHLGGRYYLSTVRQQIKLTARTIQMTPLTVYHIPCNESSSALKTGFGQCPTTLQMSVPIFNKNTVKYIPWIVPSNQSTLNLHYRSLKIAPPLKFNKSIIKSLDETFSRIDGRLHRKVQSIQKDISSIKETSATSTALIIACIALAIALLSTIVVTIIACYLWRSSRQRPESSHESIEMLTKNRDTANRCCTDCHTPMDSNTITNQTSQQ